MSSVLLDIDPRGVAHVPLNRPEVGNAYDEELLAALIDGLIRLEADPAIRARLAELEVRVRALEWSALSVVRGESSGQSLRAAEVSMLKVRGSEIEQALTEFAVDALGPLGLRYDPMFHATRNHPDADPLDGNIARLLAARAVTIYGGSNEIQRNIIAKDLLKV